ncbi:MAG: hypothetical protein CM15mP21_5360 [Hyphomicrobiales bacterium]|nr:MAG: hypothetical protein CM15mP21_5360 [Hyphomicrobiales bacterium]
MPTRLFNASMCCCLTAHRHDPGAGHSVSVFERAHCLLGGGRHSGIADGTFGVMFYLDMTINMLSLFALIMTIGIIVDDAIVVGEHSATLIERGETALPAAEGGAIRMPKCQSPPPLDTLAAVFSRVSWRLAALWAFLARYSVGSVFSVLFSGA